MSQVRSENAFVSLSQRFLEANIQRNNADQLALDYENINLDELKLSLLSYNEKLAFWINTYNAFIQYQLLSNPSIFEDRSTFYTTNSINIGGELISFDIIEHGIIRNSRWKLGLGYLKKWNCTKFEKMFRTKGKDGRVHFALNCGAISCPPVAIYNDDNLDHQLAKVIKSFLPTVTLHDTDSVTTTPLFSWFRGDFGGTKGIKKFLSNYDIIDVGSMELKYGEYDWTLDLNNIFKKPH